MKLPNASLQIPVVVLTVCLAIASCSPRVSIIVAGPKGTSAEAERAIYELIVRHLAAEEPSAHTILVSFGASWADEVDPPAAFFERLQDVAATFRPASESDSLSTPNPLLFVIHMREWKGDSEATVSATRYRFGAGVSDGFTARVTWADGAWKVARTLDHWTT